MEVIQNSEFDFNSNLFQDGGYWEEGGKCAKRQRPEEGGEMDGGIVQGVAALLEGCLREAKKVHLACGQVLLPPDLLTRVARDILRMAETEPCGLRGASISVHFDPRGNAVGSSSSSSKKELHSSNSSLNSTSSNGSAGSGASSSAASHHSVRLIGNVRVDVSTVTTFELHLTLREDPAPWYSRLTQILRNFTKGGTIVVSPGYTISKKKLYRSH